MTNTAQIKPGLAGDTAAAKPQRQPKQPKPRRMAREPQGEVVESPTVSEPAAAAAPAPAAPHAGGKQALVIALLHRPEGASIAELMAATGRLAHSTRAALTGLRKKGHAIERSQQAEGSRYRITGAA